MQNYGVSATSWAHRILSGVNRSMSRRTSHQPDSDGNMDKLMRQKLETIVKPCLECANLTDTSNQFTAACVDAGFSNAASESSARALAACVGGVAAGAVAAVWF